MATAKVLSFSISGGDTPWNDNDRSFLDVVDSGVLVAASAGNTGAGVPDPVGQVNHRGPWVLDSSRIHQGPGARRWSISASGPGSPPPDTQNIPLRQRERFARWHSAQRFSNSAFYRSESRLRRLQVQPPFPANFFSGAMALIRRGNCTFTEKITNAFNAGAAMVVIRNNQPGTVINGHYRTAQRPSLQLVIKHRAML